MKQRKLGKKLVLAKETIANLEIGQLKDAKGGLMASNDNTQCNTKPCGTCGTCDSCPPCEIEPLPLPL